MAISTGHLAWLCVNHSFGLMQAYGVHVNGYVKKEGQLSMWVARRSKDKPTWPGLLDHVAAGGQVHLLSPSYEPPRSAAVAAFGKAGAPVRVHVWTILVINRWSRPEPEYAVVSCRTQSLPNKAQPSAEPVYDNRDPGSDRLAY